MKYISLLCLVIQNATLILSMRYARTMPGDQFYSTVAVMCTELLKIFLCLIVVLFEVKGSFSRYFQLNGVRAPAAESRSVSSSDFFGFLSDETRVFITRRLSFLSDRAYNAFIGQSLDPKTALR